MFAGVAGGRARLTYSPSWSSASHIAAPRSRSGMITAMIADCGSSVPSVKPSALRPA